MRANYEETLKRIAVANEDVIVMTAENRAAIRSLETVLGDRFIDVGICEQTLIGAAAGLALRGRIPIVHALAPFLTLRAFEFIRTDVGLAALPVKMIGGFPGFLSEANGPTHQSLEDIALMRTIPNVQIFCPADEQELVSGLPAIIDSPSPCYIRCNTRDEGIEHSDDFQIGKAEVVSEGSDVAILVYGFLFREAVRAQELLEHAGVSVRLVNLRMLEPIDEAAILESAERSRLLVTIEDHFLTGGLYSIVCEILVRRRMMHEVLPIAFDRRWFKPALLEDALRYEGFTGDQIAERIMKSLETKGDSQCPIPYASTNATPTSRSPMSTTLAR